MIRVVRSLIPIVIGISAVAPALTTPAQNTPNTVFVMTNSADKNEIIVYSEAQGHFYEANRYATEGRGSGGTTDPLQSQGSLTLSRDRSMLFAVNAGSGTLSAFCVHGSYLRITDKAPTGGAEPVSVAQAGNFVYVLNAAGDGSVIGFTLGREGHLRRIPDSINYLTGTNTGGSSITISPDGQFLAVTERVANNIDTFHINSDGTLSPIIVYSSAPPGVFSASFAPEGNLIVSETGPATGVNASTISSYKVSSAGTLSAATQSLPTFGGANCWNVVTPNGKWVYVSNSSSSTISGFAIGKGGILIPIGHTVVGTQPEGSTNLDIAATSDSKYLFNLDSSTGVISVYAIQCDGSLTEKGQIEGLPREAGFNGIAAL